MRWDGKWAEATIDLTARRMFLEVSTWRRTGSHYLFLFSLDTSGSKAYEGVIELGLGGSRPPTCIVRGRAGFIIGDAQVTRPNHRSVGCVIPRAGSLVSTVRFGSTWSPSTLLVTVLRTMATTAGSEIGATSHRGTSVNAVASRRPVPR